VILSIVARPVVIVGIGYGLWRVIGPNVRKHFARTS